MEESLSKFLAESVKRHEENSNLIKEIRASTDAAIRNQGASIKPLEIQIGQMSENSKLFFVPNQVAIPFPSSLYDDCYDKEKGSYEMKDLDAYSIGTTLLDDALPTKEKHPWSFTLPSIINNLCFNKALADLRAGVSVMPFSTYTKLGLGIDKFVFPVNFIVLDMPKHIKTPLILGRPFLSTTHTKIDVFKRSLDPLYGDYIELNDLNEPLELRRNQVGDLEPTIVEGEVVDEPMMNIVKTRCDNELIDGLDEYPSYCDFDRKIHIDCAYNQIVENMDSYHDEEIGDIIVGRQFSRDACVKARRFDGMITIYKGNDSVTYQMA
ncbi:ribonuclease H-like domain, reverse transcriptase, RNA-dependent DNA polymerase [Tanacetum coccineum]